jgi:hypothetical protein
MNRKRVLAVAFSNKAKRIVAPVLVELPDGERSDLGPAEADLEPDREDRLVA